VPVPPAVSASKIIGIQSGVGAFLIRKLASTMAWQHYKYYETTYIRLSTELNFISFLRRIFNLVVADYLEGLKIMFLNGFVLVLT
jgi:hypothetical protein